MENAPENSPFGKYTTLQTRKASSKKSWWIGAFILVVIVSIIFFWIK